MSKESQSNRIMGSLKKAGRTAKEGAKRVNKSGARAAAKRCGIDTGLGALEQVLVEASRKKLDLKKSAKNVVTAGGTSGARSAAIKGTAYGLEKAAIKAGIKQTGKQAAKQGFKQAAKSGARGNVFFSAAIAIVDQGTDTYRLARGKIDNKEYKIRTGENASGAAGSVGGAAAGAALGTLIVPGAGTVVGAVIGGIAGDLGGRSGAKKLFR